MEMIFSFQKSKFVRSNKKGIKNVFDCVAMIFNSIFHQKQF